jgi:hypothetical protein
VFSRFEYLSGSQGRKTKNKNTRTAARVAREWARGDADGPKAAHIARGAVSHERAWWWEGGGCGGCWGALPADWSCAPPWPWYWYATCGGGGGCCWLAWYWVAGGWSEACCAPWYWYACCCWISHAHVTRRFIWIYHTNVTEISLHLLRRLLLLLLHLVLLLVLLVLLLVVLPACLLVRLRWIAVRGLLLRVLLRIRRRRRRRLLRARRVPLQSRAE